MISHRIRAMRRECGPAGSPAKTGSLHRRGHPQAGDRREGSNRAEDGTRPHQSPPTPDGRLPPSPTTGGMMSEYFIGVITQVVCRLCSRQVSASGHRHTTPHLSKEAA